MNRITYNVGTGFDKDGKSISARVVLGALVEIRATLATVFGGYTEHETQGGWINGMGDLVIENGVQFTVITNGERAEEAYKMAEFMARVLNQESVLFTTEGVHTEFVQQKVEA